MKKYNPQEAYLKLKNKKELITVDEERKLRDEANLLKVKYYIGLASKDYLEYKKEKHIKMKVFDSNKLLKEQLEVFQDYYKHYRSQIKQRSTFTLINIFHNLTYFADYIKKPFNKVTKQDIENYVEYLRDKNKKETTISNRLGNIKCFFKWLYQMEDTFPDVVKWIKPKLTLKERKMSELVTPNDIMKLISFCDNTRNEALIGVTYESGVRIDEILTLAYDGIKEENGLYEITVTGKTGTRTVQLLYSSNYLRAWLNNHPFRTKFEKTPNLPIFIDLKKQYGRKLGYSGAQSILQKVVERSKINKKVTWHLLRHSRGTELNLKGFNDKDLRVFMGHSKTSPMPSYYSHYGEEEVNNKLKNMYGLGDKEEEKLEIKKYEALKPVICKECKSSNPSTSLYCDNCNNPLNEKAIKKQKAISVMNELFKDDEFIEVLDKYLLKRKLKDVS